MSRLNTKERALLEIEAITRGYNSDFSKQEIINEINIIIDKAYG